MLVQADLGPHSRLTESEILSWVLVLCSKGFPCGSAGKESACSEGDLGLIPGLGRSPGEGKGYPLQYSGLENLGHKELEHHWVTFTPSVLINPPDDAGGILRFENHWCQGALCEVSLHLLIMIFYFHILFEILYNAFPLFFSVTLEYSWWGNDLQLMRKWFTAKGLDWKITQGKPVYQMYSTATRSRLWPSHKLKQFSLMIKSACSKTVCSA